MWPLKGKLKVELYNQVAYAVSRLITLDYSTSFGSSTKLFSKSIRPHIFAIYGLVRIADEIVDSYRGSDAAAILDNLETEVYSSLKRQYSANPVVQAFVLTANQFGINQDLIKPFFDSMRMDIDPSQYSDDQYQAYIYGSAEVIGLMCLKVFTAGNQANYKSLETGARSLGSAYQKVNFLRDLAADYKILGRVYFPGVEFESFDEATKGEIIKDIEADFKQAEVAINQLPSGCITPVKMSYVYYQQLLHKLRQTPAEEIKQTRVRISNLYKTRLWLATVVGEKLRGR